MVRAVATGGVEHMLKLKVSAFKCYKLCRQTKHVGPKSHVGSPRLNPSLLIGQKARMTFEGSDFLRLAAEWRPEGGL